MDYAISFFDTMGSVWISWLVAQGALSAYVSLLFLLIMAMLFVSEVFLYFMRRPKGLSSPLLLVVIVGVFFGVFLAFYQLDGDTSSAGIQFKNQLLVSTAMGLLGSVLAGVLSLLEHIFTSQKPDHLLRSALQELTKAMKETKNQPVAYYPTERSTGARDTSDPLLASGGSSLQHLSQQIYDLTNHIKFELDKERINDDKNTERLLVGLNELKSVLKEEAGGQKFSILGPKIAAKTSSFIPDSSNDDHIFHKQ